MTETGQSLASFGLCLSARKAVVDKQMGADPNLPGPGQYINPLTEGRNTNGEVKGVLSSQKNVPSVCFSMEGKGEHGRPIEKQLNSSDTMGPKYTLDNVTHGKQVQSRIRSAPSATFGSGPQRYHGGASFKTRVTEPSPQHYETQNITTGVLRLSTQRNVPGTKFMTGQQKRAKFPTSKAPISAIFHSFRLIFGRAIISRNGLEAWMLFPERARAEHSR